MSKEALKLALESSKELVADPETDFGPAYAGAEQRQKKAITAIREALAEQPAPMIRGDIRDGLVDDEPAQQQELVAWKNAALRVGEDLCSVGPFGYYDMTAEQWLDWALSVVTVHAPPAQQQEPGAPGALAKRRIFDYIRGAYDLGYNDARQARTIPGDNAPGYKGRDVEADHGGALLHVLEALTSPQPAQPSKPWVGLTEFDIDQIPYSCSHAESRLIAYAIEAKLKEKNAQPSKPLPFNKEDMEGLDVNQRLGFKLGWKSAEEAHGIKEKT